jgi:hypothetical protein
MGFFEYLQQIEQYCKEKNFAPSEFDRRATCLLSGVSETVPYLKNQIQQHVQNMISETDTDDKWGKLWKLLLKEYVPTHWCNALVTEWLNSFNQDSKPTSLYIAYARNWSTVIAMMLTHGQISEPMLALLMSALSHQDVTAKMENFICQPNKLNETLTVLQLTESQCPTNFNLAKEAKLDNSHDGDNAAERPARAETTVVMKVI